MTEKIIPDGYKLVAVKGLDELVYWLERCKDKGHIENCADLIEPFEAFEYRNVSEESVISAHEAKAAPAAPQGEPFGYFRAEPFGWTDCAETDEGAIALYEAPPDVETLRKELAGANDFIKSLADVCQKYEELLGYRKTNAPEGASELAEAKGESSLNTELGLASDKSTCQHDFALDPKSSIRICLKCGTPERRAIKPTPAAPSQPVNRPQNCGTSFCSCIECVCEPEPVTLTDAVKALDDLQSAFMSHTQWNGTPPSEVIAARAIIAALREKGQA